MSRLLVVLGVFVAACSLTPVPDLSENFSPPCDPRLRRCVQPFTRVYAKETSVELRGDFAPDAWVRGVSMVSDGGSWSASVEAVWGADIQYKHYVNGTTWELDPGNPNSTPDGNGNTNSVVRNLTCAKWTCVGQ